MHDQLERFDPQPILILEPHALLDAAVDEQFRHVGDRFEPDFAAVGRNQGMQRGNGSAAQTQVAALARANEESRRLHGAPTLLGPTAANFQHQACSRSA